MNKEAQYEDLKKKLLAEYKKMKKSTVSTTTKPKTDVSLANSKVLASNDGSGAATNLNNSTNSAHMNVYKPTFIINNSYQTEENREGRQNFKPNINNPQNLQVAAGPSSEKRQTSADPNGRPQ